MKSGLQAFLQRRSFAAVFALVMLSTCMTACAKKQGGDGDGSPEVTGPPPPPPAVELVSLEVDPATQSLPLGSSQKFTAKAAYSDRSTRDVTADTVWSSAAPQLLSVEADGANRGTAKALAVGSAVLKAEFGGKAAMVAVTVSAAALASLAITPENPEKPAGTMAALIATGTYTDQSTRDITADVEWSTSAEAVATVTNDEGDKGKLLAVAAGTATIKAKSGDIEASTEVTVSTATLNSVEVTASSATLATGAARQLAAKGTYSDSSIHDLTQTATWTSSDAALAAVSDAAGAKGLVTAAAVGSVDIKATQDSIDGSLTLTLAVPDPPIIAYGAAIVAPVNVALAEQVPANTGAPIVACAISPNLETNTGLTFNADTGAISGTPTSVKALETYTVTATAEDGSQGATTVDVTVTN